MTGQLARLQRLHHRAIDRVSYHIESNNRRRFNYWLAVACHLTLRIDRLK